MCTHQLKNVVLGGICFLVIISILAQQFQPFLTCAPAFERQVLDFRFPRRIDYNASMDRITQYRLSTYSINITYKWLFLCTFREYRVAMDRNYFSQYYAAKRHPNINATLWGANFPGW
jgi:hypothetical protein